jgi:hypothetical protein
MKAMLLGCIRLWRREAKTRAGQARRCRPVVAPAKPHRASSAIEETRRHKMIRDTERYLSNPRSKAWPIAQVAA